MKNNFETFIVGLKCSWHEQAQFNTNLLAHKAKYSYPKGATTQHNDTQRNYIQHKDTQHDIKVIATLSIMTLNAECRKQAHYAACLNAEYFL